MAAPRIPVRLLAGIGLGALSAFLVLGYVSGAERKLQERYSGIQVLVADRDIPENTLVTPGMVRAVPMPKEQSVEGALTELSQLGAKVTTLRILRGDQLSVRKLIDKRSAESRYVAVPQGMRAVTVTPDDSSEASALIRPGDRIDVVMTYDQGLTAESKTVVAEDIEVARRPTANAPAPNTSQGDTALSVTLLVTPTQAEEMTYADEFGKLRLLLRPLDLSHKAGATTARSGGQGSMTIASLKAPAPANVPHTQKVGEANTLPRNAESARISVSRVTVPVGVRRSEVSPTIEIIRGTETSTVPVAIGSVP